MKKKLLIVLVVMLLLVVASLTAFVLTLDSTIKKSVEEGGSYALKVPVKLEKVSVSLMSGEASLKGLSVANPKGFKTPTAISLQEVSARIKLSSLTGEVIEVPEIILRGPKLTIETRALGLRGSNLKQLMKNLEETMAEHGVAGEKPPDKPDAAPAPAPAGKEQLYRVGRILITDATLGFADSLTRGRESTATIKEIELTELSTDMTMGQIIEKCLRAIVKAATKSPGKIGKIAGMLSVQSVRGVVEGTVGGVGKVIKGTVKGTGEVVKGIGKGTGEVVKGVGKGIGEIGKGIGNIFKKKKPEDETKEEEKK